MMKHLVLPALAFGAFAPAVAQPASTALPAGWQPATAQDWQQQQPAAQQLPPRNWKQTAQQGWERPQPAWQQEERQDWQQQGRQYGR